MLSRRLAVSLVVALFLATVEAWDIHTDDGCAVETHCDVCLLKLAATGLPTAAFSLPPVVPIAPFDAPAPAAQLEDAAPRDLPTRGPPTA